MEERTHRIFEEFKELVEIDSISFHEREMADRLTQKLTELGFEVSEDDAGSRYGGNAGNIYGFLKGELPGESILLAAHMDTVGPGIGKKAFLQDDGKIVSDGTTVLGADDVTGIVGILEGIRSVLGEGKPHRDIEVMFPIGEELYNRGSILFDFNKIKSKTAYVLDVSGPVGTAAVQAPTIISFEVDVRGKASHAGFAPEAGIHAIKIMSKGIVNLKQGHLDEETTLNIGVIKGGEATNIVPELVTCVGELRSYDHEKALSTLEYVKKTFEAIATDDGAEVEMRYEIKTKAYKIPENTFVVNHFKEACQKLGFKGKLISTFGGSDNNNFAAYGIEGIVLSCGMYQVHSTKEYSYVKDLVDIADLVKELIM